MALNDIYRLIVNQTYLGQEALNVFWYRLIGLGTGNDDAEELINAFSANVWGDIVAIQNDQVQTTLYEAVNFNDLTDFSSLLSNATGDRTGQALPSFVTWTFQLQRATLTLRNGRKAIAGVSETDQENGVPSTGIDSLLVDAATAMASEITATEGSVWKPCIVRKPSVPLPTVPTFVDIKGAAFRRISSQNSRKPS